MKISNFDRNAYSWLISIGIVILFYLFCMFMGYIFYNPVPPVPNINWDSVEFKKSHVIQDNPNDTTTERIPSHKK